jgi:hypothetical protein
MTDPPTFKMPGPIAATYIERHFAKVLYCRLTNGDLYLYN